MAVLIVSLLPAEFGLPKTNVPSASPTLIFVRGAQLREECARRPSWANSGIVPSTHRPRLSCTKAR